MKVKYIYLEEQNFVIHIFYVYLLRGGGALFNLNVNEQHINKTSVKFLSKAYVIISQYRQ